MKYGLYSVKRKDNVPTGWFCWSGLAGEKFKKYKGLYHNVEIFITEDLNLAFEYREKASVNINFCEILEVQALDLI